MSSKKLPKQQFSDDFKSRLISAFGGKSLKDIAILLDENYNSLWNWATGRTEMPHKVLAKIAKTTDCSLNWLLTGEGEKKVATRQRPTLINEENLELFVRSIVREEIHAVHVQDLGTVDEFDISNAVERLDDPHQVMREWFLLEGCEYPRDFGIIFFEGWETFTLEKKIDAIRDAKKALDRTLKSMKGTKTKC